MGGPALHSHRFSEHATPHCGDAKRKAGGGTNARCLPTHGEVEVRDVDRLVRSGEQRVLA